MRRRCISWNGPLAWSVQEAEMEGQMQGSYSVVVTCMYERRRQRRLLDYVTPSVSIMAESMHSFVAAFVPSCAGDPAYQ